MAPLLCAAQFHRGRAEWIGEELDKGVSDTRQSADNWDQTYDSENFHLCTTFFSVGFVMIYDVYG